MGNIKIIDTKKCAYHVFNDMINIKNLQIKVDKTSYKNIDVYYVR